MLAVVLRDDDAADVEADGAEGVDQAHDVEIVGDAEIAAALVHLDVRGVDGDDDFRLILELQQHLHLAVGLEAGQHARGVIVVEQLAAELEVQLAAEGVHSFEDPLGLKLEIFFIVKTDLVHSLLLETRNPPLFIIYTGGLII